MDVVSMCPLRVASVVWQPRPGAFALTVACKATYRLEPLSSSLAATQEEVHEGDRHRDGNETRSLWAASDLAPFKRRTDITLVGSAFAPGGAPVRSLVARLQVGDVDKAIEVWPDRSFTPDGSLLEGPRFVRAPLPWERAAGGPNSANPVGMRFDAPPSREGRVAVPNLQPPWKRIARAGDTFDPIGFGPIAPWWPGRAWLLHHHAPGWSHRRWFDRPLPHDVDPRYFNAAPPDQQTNPLQPDARILLENLHPEHPRLVTNLVPVRPRARVERPGRAPEPLELTCDTVWIDTDRALCTLTFRGMTPITGATEAGRITVHLEGSEPAAVIAAPPPRAPAPEPHRQAATLDTSALRAMAQGNALPFLPSKTGAEEKAAPARPLAVLAFPRTETTGARRPDAEESTVIYQGADLVRKAQTLPFAGGARTPAVDEPTRAVDLDSLRRERGALPFASGPVPSPPVVAPATPRARSHGTIPPPPLETASGASPAFWRTITSAPDESRDEPRDDEPPEPDTVRPPAPLPTALLPGLPSPAFTAPPVPRFADVPARIEPEPRRPPPPPEEEAEPLDVDVYAAVKVAFWHEGERGRVDLEETVRALGLDEDAFRAGEERLLEALAAEARDGHATLARALRAAMKGALRAAAERAERGGPDAEGPGMDS